MSEHEHATTDTDVDAQVAEFTETVRNSKPYQQFVENQRRLQSDEKAQQLLQEYQTKQQQLQRGGFDQETMGELREIKADVEANETIAELRRAEEELLSLLEETNDIISEKIGQEFARTTGGGCC